MRRVELFSTFHGKRLEKKSKKSSQNSSMDKKRNEKQRMDILISRIDGART